MANNIIKTNELIDKLNKTLLIHSEYLTTAATAAEKLSNAYKIPSAYVSASKKIANSQKEVKYSYI